MSGLNIIRTASVAFAFIVSAYALERPGMEFKVYQFPADAIPRMDGDASDWEQVPDSYAVGTDQFWEDSGRYIQSPSAFLEPPSIRIRYYVDK